MEYYGLFLCTLIFSSFHSSSSSKKEEAGSDLNFYAEMASSLLQEQNGGENIGGLISNLIQSEGGKQLGEMLMGMGSNKNGNQILQSLGSLVAQNTGSESGGFDPTMIASMLSAFTTAERGNKNQEGEITDNLFSMLGNLAGESGGMENAISLLPMLLNTVSSFSGEEAHKREEEHAGHSWILPPVIEKLHIGFDHFMNSQLGKSLMKSIGTEKFFKVFTDADGRFNLSKFLELLENHSFRKHWIELITRRVASVISYFADPKTQKRFLTNVQYVLNNILKTQGFPKVALFDAERPSETITAFINYSFKRYLNYKVNAKQYVRPAFDYFQDVVKIAQKQGFFTGRGIDSAELSHKLADTINLEIIEPAARVYRAYRFAKKNPTCDRYVMCLVNQEEPNEVQSLPGLKNILSKGSSLFASWFLSGHTGTSYWTLYQVITEDTDCQSRFVQHCNDFHVEEIRVTTEYVHNEL